MFALFDPSCLQFHFNFSAEGKKTELTEKKYIFLLRNRQLIFEILRFLIKEREERKEVGDSFLKIKAISIFILHYFQILKCFHFLKYSKHILIFWVSFQHSFKTNDLFSLISSVSENSSTFNI